MRDVSLVPSALIDARELAATLAVSLPTVWRMRDANRLPAPLRLTAQCLRWRRRTGNPATGVDDWIDAGCPALNEQCTPNVEVLEGARSLPSAGRTGGAA